MRLRHWTAGASNDNYVLASKHFYFTLHTIKFHQKENGVTARLEMIMEIANQWCERNSIVRAVCAFQESIAYPIFFAILCVVSGMTAKEIYLPILILIFASVLFSAIFVKDNKVFLPPLFMGYYALGNDDEAHLKMDDSSFLEDFDTRVFWIAALLVVGIIFARLCADGTFTHLKRQRGVFFGGIIAMDIAFLLNGVLSPRWHMNNLLYALTMIFGFTLCYFIFFSIFDRTKNISHNRHEELTVYTCICVVCAAAIVFLQLMLLVGKLYLSDTLFHYIGNDPVPQLNRGNLRLPWGGYATNIAAVIILGIPAAMYLARNRRFPILSYTLSILFFGGAFLTGTRSAILVGGLALIVSIFISCFGAKNSKQIRLFSLILILGLVFVLLYINRFIYPLHQLWKDTLKFLRLEHLLDLSYFDDDVNEARLSLWKNAWDDFCSAPIFGVGFSDGGYENPVSSNAMACMYHNIVFEFLGAMGLVGIVAFIWHLVDVFRVLFRRFTANKTLIMLLPLMILATSMFDNFFFFLNFQIFYCAYLSLAEHHDLNCTVTS